MFQSRVSKGSGWEMGREAPLQPRPPGLSVKLAVSIFVLGHAAPVAGLVASLLSYDGLWSHPRSFSPPSPSSVPSPTGASAFQWDTAPCKRQTLLAHGHGVCASTLPSHGRARAEVWISSGHLLLLTPTSLIIPGNANAINGAISVINLAGMSLPA